MCGFRLPSLRVLGLGFRETIPKGPCRYMVYTWVLKRFPYLLSGPSIYHIPTWTLWEFVELRCKMTVDKQASKTPRNPPLIGVI